MRKYIFTLGVLVSLAVSSSVAQTKIRDIFLQMPDSMLPYLTENNRLDFLDFMDSGMKAEVRNELEGHSEMLALSDEELLLQVSPSMKVQMRMMPVSEEVDSCTQVVCVITTYGKDAPESQIAVYSVKWRSVSVASHLSLPQGPYVATYMDSPVAGVTLKQSSALDFVAHEEQEKETDWLKNIEWKP